MTSNNTQSARTRSLEEAVSDDDGIDHEKAQEGIKLLLEAIGEDPDEPPYAETWQRRVPEAFATLSEGNRQEAKPELTTFEATNDELVIKTGIPVYSLCGHHLLPYHGRAHVAYVPAGQVVGLSKLTRYVRWQSRRLTMQEELTQSIAEGLEAELDSEAVLVELDATHLCEAMRGIETASTTTTRAFVGSVDQEHEQQFRDAIARGRTTDE